MGSGVMGFGGVIGSGVGGVANGIGGVARPGLDALKGMTQSASQFLRRTNTTESANATSGATFNGTGSWSGSTTNLFLAARKASSGVELDNTSSFPSFRNILRTTSGSSRRSNSTTDLDNPKKDGENEGKKKEKKSVLKRVSKVGKDAVESVVLKKKLMRVSTGQLEDTSDLSASKRRRNATVMEEDPTGGLTPKKLFSSLKIESGNHPFFKRVWTIRHVLNADSPLISERARTILKETKGRWPAETCNHSFIRRNVDFQQLIVSMSGTTTGTKVYGLHVYEYRNLHVGYTFSPILQYSPDGRLLVDLDSIDNIQEQRGGGAESINYEQVTRMTEPKTVRERQKSLLRRLETPDVSSGGLNFTTHSIAEVDESMLSGAFSRNFKTSSRQLSAPTLLGTGDDSESNKPFSTEFRRPSL